MLLFDSVQLPELVELGHKRINDLHALEQLGTALLIAPIFLTLSCIILAL